MSDDREQEYFSDGITDDLITDLSRLPDLFVIARNSTFTYKGKPTKLQDISKELGVKYVLEGGVRKAADQANFRIYYMFNRQCGVKSGVFLMMYE